MSTSDPTTQTTLNIPSLIAFAFLSFLFLRYFFSSSSNTNASESSSYPGATSSARRRVTPEKIDTVATMFPQLQRRDIEWDLLRNGGSVQATTEKVLREGRLENPPPNFRASTPPTGTPTPSSSNRNGQQQPKPTYDDLITRYNLSSKVGAATSSSSSTGVEGQTRTEKPGWSANKNDRAEMLKRRREEMVLNARRKMEEAQRMKGGGGGS